MNNIQHHRIVLFIIACFGWGCGSIVKPVASADATPQQINFADLSSDLRGVYYETTPDAKKQPRVARLAVRLISTEGERKVRLDYPFKSQDRFRFEVSSNRDGWLYVLHKSPQGEPQILWPKTSTENDATTDINRITTNQSYLVPPDPGRFVFDKEVGAELFYVVIQSKKQTPHLVVIESLVKNRETKFERVDTAAQPKTRIAQIGVRSRADTIGESYRSVIFDPGIKDDDPNIYFSAQSKNINDTTIFEFKLQHGY